MEPRDDMGISMIMVLLTSSHHRVLRPPPADDFDTAPILSASVGFYRRSIMVYSREKIDYVNLLPRRASAARGRASHAGISRLIIADFVIAFGMAWGAGTFIRLPPPGSLSRSYIYAI